MIFCVAINTIYLASVPVLLLLYNRVEEFEMPKRAILYIVIYYGVYFIHAIILLETLLTRQKQVDFWNTLLQIEGTYSRDRNSLRGANINLKKKFLVRILALSIFVAISKLGKLIINLSSDKNYHWIIIEGGSLVSQECIRLTFFSHFLFVEIVRMHITLYNNKIQEITRKIKSYRQKEFFNELNVLIERHNLIWKLTNHLNSFFKWAQIICFLYNFFTMTNFLYWINFGATRGNFDQIISKFNFLNYYEKYVLYFFILLFFFQGNLFNLIQCIVSLVNVIYSCELIKIESSKTPQYIHEISRVVRNPFDQQLHNFVMAISMQIHHEDIFITYGGFFKLDLSLITTVRFLNSSLMC